MKLITELLNEGIECCINEASEGGKKNYYIIGPYMQAECVNRNKRYYPKPILEKALNEYIDKFVTPKRALGELNHPDKPSVNLERASHLIESLQWEGNNVMGKAKLLSTPMGQIAKALIDEGVKLGVSSRALGSLNQRSDGINEVKSDLRLSTIDIVADPSGPSCFVDGIMENAEWVFDAATGNYFAQELIHESRKEIHKFSLRQLNEAKVNLFANFLDAISKNS